MFKSTRSNLKFWSKRQINWGEHYWNPEHPHRTMIINILTHKVRRFGSIIEVGCAAGANLARVKLVFPHVDVGGVDPNPEAIEEARRRVPGGTFEVGHTHDLFFSDRSVDVTLTDACLLYVSPLNIKDALREIRRVTRTHVVLCELYHPNWFVRLVAGWSGYSLHNYPKLLMKMGFYDVEVHKIPEHVWPGLPWSRFGYMFVAKK
jgi:hypothetical protein